MEENSKKTLLRTIERKPFDGSVEIIIPFHGKQALVSNLIQFIFNSIHSNRYLITLVDDGSKNSFFYDQIQKANITNVRILKNNENKGFGASVNLALKNPFKLPDGSERIIPYVVIMHSDVIPFSKDWLFNLGSSLEVMKFDGVKMVSPLTNNPLEGSQRLVSKNKSPNLEDFVLSDEEFLPMYCVLSHRDLFKYVQVPEFPPYSGLEAREFSSNMRSRGFLQGVCGKSWVHHEGRATSKLFDKTRRRNNIAKNQNIDSL